MTWQFYFGVGVFWTGVVVVCYGLVSRLEAGERPNTVIIALFVGMVAGTSAIATLMLAGLKGLGWVS